MCIQRKRDGWCLNFGSILDLFFSYLLFLPHRVLHRCSNVNLFLSIKNVCSINTTFN